MSGLEDRLSLDISDALSAVSQLESAFVASAKTIQDALDQAVASFTIPDTAVDFTANVDEVAPAIDAAVASADTQLDLFADAGPITSSIDDAIAQADTTLEVNADVSQAQDAISSLEGETVQVGVETTGLDEAASGLDAVGTAGEHAAQGGHHAAGEFGALAGVSKLAAGETGALKEVLGEAGPAGLAAAAGVGAFAAVGSELVSNAIDARSAQERYNLILGDFAETVDHIDIGGLNTDLGELSVKLGATGIETEEAAANIFNLGKAAGVAQPQVAETTKEVIALAARAVALKPSLGNVGDVAQRLFTGLARGGRFAANFGISLTAAEISARALADTGKATAADLTVYEKAAAGAALATEKLGTSLGSDVEAGSKNIRIQFEAVKASFEEALEALGQPLLDPLLSAIQKAEPLLADLAAAFADILTGLLPVGDALVDGLIPALDVVGPIAQALGNSLKIVADVLNIIPGPLKAAVVSFVALNVAMKAILETRLASVLAGFGGPLSNISTFAVPAAAALTATGVAMAYVNSQAKKTDDAVQSFANSTVDLVNQAPDIEHLGVLIGQIHDKAQAERDAAAKNRGGLFGDFGTRGETRGFDEAATALDSIEGGATKVLQTAKKLREEFGLSSAAALALARSGEEQVKAFEEQSGVAQQLTADQLAAARATDEFWLAAQTGSLTAAQIQERATATGATFEDMAKAVQDARQPILDFATSIEEALPGATKALNDLGENDGLKKFVDNLKQNVEDSANFISNLQTLIDRGATDLAALLGSEAKADPGKAAKLAAEAVKQSQAALDKTEGQIDATNFGRKLVDQATQNVADELGGGLELAAKQAQDRFGAAMLKIPGQVDATGKQTGRDIATNLIAEILLPFQHLSDDMEQAGKDAIAGFETGIGNSDNAAVAAAIQAKKVIDSVRKILGIASPSKVFQEIGELVVEGFAAGLSDIQGATDFVDPILAKLDEFKLGAADLAKATGNSSKEIVASLDAIGKAQQNLTPEQLLDVGKAVKALGGEKGVGQLQKALAQQVSSAFGGLGGKEISDIVSKLNTQAALAKVTSVVGVTPTVPKPFETNVVKGADASTAASVIGEVNVTVTPPPEATPEEIAALTANAIGWQLQGVQ